MIREAVLTLSPSASTLDKVATMLEASRVFLNHSLRDRDVLVGAKEFVRVTIWSLNWRESDAPELVDAVPGGSLIRDGHAAVRIRTQV